MSDISPITRNSTTLTQRCKSTSKHTCTSRCNNPITHLQRILFLIALTITSTPLKPRRCNMKPREFCVVSRFRNGQGQGQGTGSRSRSPNCHTCNNTWSYPASVSPSVEVHNNNNNTQTRSVLPSGDKIDLTQSAIYPSKISGSVLHPNRCQNLITWCYGHAPPFQKLSIKSVHNFLVI